jgi:hypothetical protein
MVKIDNSPVLIRVCQGDIISNVEYIEYAIEKEGQIEISKIVFPYVYVLTQDCDLEQEFNNRNNVNAPNQDKHLISVIVAPFYNIEHVYDGEHLSQIGLKMQTINRKPTSTENKILKDNRNPRYHFLQFPTEVKISDSVIDFKHYFTVNSILLHSLKSTNFVCKVSELYREQISHRFSFFLSRIGLPNMT